jgi:hypothetical protein
MRTRHTIEIESDEEDVAVTSPEEHDEGNHKKAVLQYLFRNKHITETKFNRFNVPLLELNHLLEPFHFKLVKYHEKYFIVNTLNDTLTCNFASNFTANEIHLFKMVMTLICQSESKMLSESDIIREIKAVNFALTQGETQATQSTIKNASIDRLLETLVDQEWLERSSNYKYMLAPRTLVELYEFLHTLDEGALDECAFCRYLMAHEAVECSSCENSYHKYCYEKLSSNGSFSCLYCQEPFRLKATDTAE